MSEGVEKNLIEALAEPKALDHDEHHDAADAEANVLKTATNAMSIVKNGSANVGDAVDDLETMTSDEGDDANGTSVLQEFDCKFTHVNMKKRDPIISEKMRFLSEVTKRVFDKENKALKKSSEYNGPFASQFEGDERKYLVGLPQSMPLNHAIALRRLISTRTQSTITKVLYSTYLMDYYNWASQTQHGPYPDIMTPERLSYFLTYYINKKYFEGEDTKEDIAIAESTEDLTTVTHDSEITEESLLAASGGGDATEEGSLKRKRGRPLKNPELKSKTKFKHKRKPTATGLSSRINQCVAAFNWIWRFQAILFEGRQLPDIDDGEVHSTYIEDAEKISSHHVVKATKKSLISEANQLDQATASASGGDTKIRPLTLDKNDRGLDLSHLDLPRENGSSLDGLFNLAAELKETRDINKALSKQLTDFAEEMQSLRDELSTLRQDLLANKTATNDS